MRLLIGLMACVLSITSASGLDFSPVFNGRTLSAQVQTLDGSTGVVTINGYDAGMPNQPFRFDWGDGSTTFGFFPQNHQYALPSGNPIIRVTAFYPNSTSDWVDVLVPFSALTVSTQFSHARFPVELASAPLLLPGQPGFGSQTIGAIDAQSWASVERASVQSVLIAALAIQSDLLDGWHVEFGGQFAHMVGSQSSFPGSGMSLWFTQPPSSVFGASFLGDKVPWSSILHEMGHAATLNFPRGYRFGGRIDGNANAIYSEAMAQIFQHVTAHELVVRAADFGLSPELVLDVSSDARSTLQWLKSQYDGYVANGMPFATWNDPGTPHDETLPVFSTLAYVFLHEAFLSGSGYREPTRRMAGLLSAFSPMDRVRWDPQNNTVSASVFRSTLMVAAMSFGLNRDMRGRMNALGFPVNALMHEELLVRAQLIYGSRLFINGFE